METNKLNISDSYTEKYNDKNKENDKSYFINFIKKNDKMNKIKIYTINSFNKHKFKLLNKSLTICLHILVMILFEIYFFFNFVIDIENDKFIGKIDEYFNKLKPIQVSYLEKQVMNRLISNEYENGLMRNLFINYAESIQRQNYILNKLLIRSYKMAIILGSIFLFLLTVSFYNCKKIEWTIIISENILMFLFLGIFEYYFFINIILNYEPVTDEELEYKITNGFIGYLNQSEIK